MITIGIISEGRTDQIIIQHVLFGYFAAHRDELEIEPVFPPERTADGIAHGGWTVLKGWLQSGAHRQVLQFRDYLVVHVDTDVCEQLGFDVSRRDPETGAPRDVMTLRAAVIDRLTEWMGRDFCETYRDRLLFAIAVDQTECWLLPLLVTQKAKQAKTTGCLQAAEHAIALAAGPKLCRGDGSKDVRAYIKASQPYLKNKTLMGLGPRNASLAALLTDLAALPITFD